MAGDTGAELVGRQAERNRLRELVGALRSGTGGAVVVDGPPGSGKSALIDELVAYVRSQGDADSATGAATCVAALVASEEEREWPYSGLHLVLSGLAASLTSPGHEDVVADLRELAADLRGPEDAYENALRLLVLLEQVRRPVLVAVDDAHVLDAASQQVLGFVARRLGPAPVLLVLGADRPAQLPPFQALATVCLGELTAADARRLLRRAHDKVVGARVAARLVAEIGGHPRALLDVAARLSPAQLAGRASMERHLPESPILRAVVLPELDAVGADRRDALLTVAVSEDRRLVALADALGGPQSPAMTWLLDDHLNVAGDTFAFRRPAVASVVWRAASQAGRDRAHQALAAAYADGDPQRLWHRARTLRQSDDGVAAALLAEAREHERRGELERAHVWVTEAVRLVSPAGDVAGALLQAGRLALLNGWFGEAVRIARERFSRDLDVVPRADLALLELRARQLLDGEVPTGLVARHLAEVAPVDPERAAGLALAAAAGFVERMERDEAARFVELAERWVPGPAGSASLRARLESLAGRHEQAVVLVSGSPSADGIDGARERIGRARVLTRAERYDEARGVFAEVSQDPVLGRSPLIAGAAAAARTELELRAGALTAAREAAVLHDRQDAGHLSRAIVAARLIEVHAWRGESELAWASRQRAVDLARRPGDTWVTALVHAGTGTLLLIEGRAAEAVPVLEHARRHALEHPDPALVGVEPGFIEACLRTGDRDRALGALAEFECRARAVPTAWARHALARCQALVDDGEAAPFVEAIESAPPLSGVELARTMLCLGERLRRTGRRGEAAYWLRRTTVLAQQSGAFALADQAEGELRATGQGPVLDDVRIDGLTRAERRIATFAAAGRRNREIAAELFVSVRTVETHLGRIYRKTGTRSRVELARLIGSGTNRPDD